MASYLFNEEPIVANKTLAKEIGLVEAIVLQQIYYWIEINKKTEKNFYEGRYWTYNSVKKWQETNFEYISVDTLKRTFSKLEKSGYLISNNFNKNKQDRTKWYTVDEDKLDELYNKVNNNCKKGQEVNKNSHCANSHFESADMHNALGQNQPMHWGNLPQPLPYTNHILNTYNIPSIHQDEIDKNNKDGKNDGSIIAMYDKYVLDFKKKFDYNIFKESENLEDNGIAEDIINLSKIFADVMILDDKSILKINQNSITANLVKKKLLELNTLDVQEILNLVKNNEYKIRNIRAFILTCAYNIKSDNPLFTKGLVSYHMRN